MPKYPISDELIDEEQRVQETIRRARYNQCCINRNVCASLSIIVCVSVFICGLTLMNSYVFRDEEQSLSGGEMITFN